MYLNLRITNVLGIVITPLFIQYLGDSDYGLFALIGAFVGYLIVLDFGLTNAVVRFVVQYQVPKNYMAQENFFASKGMQKATSLKRTFISGVTLPVTDIKNHTPIKIIHKFKKE